MKRLMKASSSVLLGLALALLVVGVLLTPNVVLADEPITPSAVFKPVCPACTGTCTVPAAPPCPFFPPPPPAPPLCGPAFPGADCTDGNGQSCTCKVTPLLLPPTCGCN